MRRTLIWDIPVRTFHWLLAVGFIAAFGLAQTQDDDAPLFMLHMVLGLVVGLMACLRVVWGLVGTEHARFSGFALAPGALLGYLGGLIGKPGSRYLGHNPASSYATLMMLGFALGLAGSGILLARGSESAEGLHEMCATGFLLVSVGHVIGVVWHAIRYRDGIVLSIIDGKKVGDPGVASVARSGVAALVFLALVGACSGLLLSGYDRSSGTIAVPGLGWTISGDDDHDEDHARKKHDRKKHDRKKHDRKKHDRDHDD